MNILFLVTAFIFVGFVVWIIKYLEKKLPERDKRIKQETLSEIKRVQVKKEYEKKQELEIKAVINKENKKKMYVDNIRKGRDYEIYIIDYFRKRGYQTKGHGLLNGKKDKGIDIIIKKDKEITLIQCKNWKKEGSYKIRDKHLKEFLGNTTAFIENNKEKAEGYSIKRLFITSNDVLHNSGRYFLNETPIVNYQIIPMEN